MLDKLLLAFGFAISFKESRLRVWGGHQLRDLLYVEDAVDALLRAGSDENAVGKIFNLGHSNFISLLNLAETLVRINEGGEVIVRDYPEDRKAIDIGDYYTDASLIKNILGWIPHTPHRPGIDQNGSLLSRTPFSIHLKWTIQSLKGIKSSSRLIPYEQLVTERTSLLPHSIGYWNRGWYILGKEVDAFEAEFSEWQTAKHAVGVANGTDALELCLRSCGIVEGDVVAMPTHTAVDNNRCGQSSRRPEPLLLDIEANSPLLDLNELENALNDDRHHKRIKAIIAVHLYGQPCDMDTILTLAQRYDLVVIEDCSQAHGARWQNRLVGSFGDASAFSCYPTKNLGALGDAGICVTNSDTIAAKIRLLRQYGWEQRYISSQVGMNSP